VLELTERRVYNEKTKKEAKKERKKKKEEAEQW